MDNAAAAPGGAQAAPGVTWDVGAALDQVRAAVAEGAYIRGDLPPARAVRGLA